MRAILMVVIFALAIIRAEGLRFVTINVWSGLDYTGNIRMGEYESKNRRLERYRILVQQLKEINPDVVAINEANKQPHFTKWIAKELNCDQIHTVGNAGIKVFNFGLPLNLKEGDAILAKKHLKLEYIGKQKLSGDRFGIYSDFFTFHFQETNFVIVGSIIYNGRRIYVANTHLYASILMSDSLKRFLRGLTDGEKDFVMELVRCGVERRQQEIRNLLKYIDAVVPDRAPLVLMGDFNDMEGSEVYVKVVEDGFVDGYRLRSSAPGYTWDPVSNTNIDPIQLDFLRSKGDLFNRTKLVNDSVRRRIDYIYVRSIEKDNVKSSKVVLDSPVHGIFPSDHYGVMLEIDLSEN